MSEQTYKKVFEVIQESLVPKTQLEESQNKILQLETIAVGKSKIRIYWAEADNRNHPSRKGQSSS